MSKKTNVWDRGCVILAQRSDASSDDDEDIIHSFQDVNLDEGEIKIPKFLQSEKTSHFTGKTKNVFFTPKEDTDIISGVNSKIKAQKQIKTKAGQQFQKTPAKSLVKLETSDDSEERLSFISSLADRTYHFPLHEQAVFFRENFPTAKYILAEILFQYFNINIFDSKMGEDVQLTWSSRLRRCAGITKMRIKSFGGVCKRTCNIVLSEVFISTPAILCEVLAHEMCHAATWNIQLINDRHGSLWRAWTKRFLEIIPEAPIITVLHNFESNWKYFYECICGRIYGQMTKRPPSNPKLCEICNRVCVLLKK